MELAQSYINVGRASLTDQFHRRILGFNHRLSELQAASWARSLSVSRNKRQSAKKT